MRSIYKSARFVIESVAWLYLSVLACLTMWVVIPMVIQWTPTVVISGSMEPAVMTGDILVAQPVSPDEVNNGMIKVGMVVLAYDPMRPTQLYTHRVVEVFPDHSMTTKGDANLSHDPIHLPASSVQGIERLRLPYIGLPSLAVRTGNVVQLSIMAAGTALAGFLTWNRKKRVQAQEAESSEAVYATRAEAKRAALSKRSWFSASLGRTTTAVALVIAAIVGGSSATFTGYTSQPTNKWVASSTFASTTASCGGGVYTVTAGATVTCAVGTVSGTTTNYTMTIQGTGALVQWSLNTDWTGVAKWQYSKAYGTGVSDTGNITQQSGYKIMGATNGCQTTATCNYGYVSSTKPAVVFTVQVTTT